MLNTVISGRVFAWGLLLLVCASACGCTTSEAAKTDTPRYVWHCRIAGGGDCYQDQIRCWGIREKTWVDEAKCAEFARPDNLVRNQSYPWVPSSALRPYPRHP